VDTVQTTINQQKILTVKFSSGGRNCPDEADMNPCATSRFKQTLMMSLIWYLPSLEENGALLFLLLLILILLGMNWICDPARNPYSQKHGELSPQSISCFDTSKFHVLRARGEHSMGSAEVGTEWPCPAFSFWF